MNKKSSPSAQATIAQLIVNFALPIFILTKLSKESSLGPTKALLLALAFPILFEFYNIYKNKKLSLVSVIAIGGIAVTGGLSLLHLGVEWLAVRRSVTYLFVAVVILVSQVIKKPVINAVVNQIFDRKKLESAASKNNSKPQLEKIFVRTSYLTAALFSLVSVLSYAVTRALVTSATNTAAYNEEYARLRILSLPYITLPMLVGFILIIWYLIHNLEKATGQDMEHFTNLK